MSEFKKTSFLDDFELPVITHDTIKQQLVKLGKTHSVKKRKSIESLPLDERLKYIEAEVFKILGRYKGFVKVIYTEEELNTYIDRAIAVDYLAFDTETNNSLDPLTCKLMGLCLYMPNTKPVYVPINHCKPGTDILLENQVSEDCVKRVLQKLKDNNVKMVYHNGKFDIRVCYNTMGVYLPIWWDTMIAAQLLNENELAKLKYQYKVHIDPTISSYNIEKLFTGLPYAWIDPEIFAFYAAIDAYDTYKLQQQQQELMEKPDMQKLYKLFTDIEVPIVLVTSEMEDAGICMDVEFLSKLNDKYTEGLNNSIKTLDDILKPYSQQIEYYQKLGKLDNPVNYESPTQLVILIYDILKIKPLEDFGRSTEKAALKALKVDFTKALLDYRHYSILIKTFTKPLPEWLSARDGKLHANFNQMGKEDNNVRTGRFSSTNPNLQQIPSKEKVMRMMFKASPGYVIVGGDFSQQEPRLLTHMCRDENLINTYNAKKDLYATIGSMVFKKDYWECMEHWEDGTPNPTGKTIRSQCKGLVLGIMYGMGAKLMSNILNVSTEECMSILDEFYKMFPAVKEFTQYNEKMAKELGYVEDYMGRRRHLPDADLPEVEVRAKKKVIVNSDVFLDMGNSELELVDEEMNRVWTTYYNENFAGKGFKTKSKFKEEAKEQNIDVFDNGAFISKTLTQCTNARIQGGAASLTKKAMVDIYNNKKLRDLGFRLLIPVHDELLGECPIENAEEVEKLLSETMIAAGKPECSVDMKVDTYVVKHWYADEVSNTLRADYIKKIKSNVSEEDAILYFISEHPELNQSIVKAMCLGEYDVLTGDV